MKQLIKLTDATGSGKSEMAAQKLEIRVSQLQDSHSTLVARPIFSRSSYPTGLLALIYD